MTAETQVVIAGGGPVGLALAVELGTRGIDCVVVEPRERGRLVPRAKLTNVRSMEHMRRWGIARELREATPLPAEYSTDIAFVTQLLGGYEIARFSNVFNTAPVRDQRFSEPAQQVPQYVVEAVLRRRAETCASVTFLPTGHRVDGFAQDDRGVRVRVSGADGASRTVAAQYLVGCDGGGSVVRQAAGIEMAGRRSIATNLSVVFRSTQLARRLPFAPALHFWTVNDRTPAFMGPSDRDGLWWLQATRLPAGVQAEDLDPRSLVEGATGEPLNDLDVVATAPWEVHELIAERLRRDRVFLAGDAAHLHSPMGAHGMNQGIGDAADLGWKLAAVLDGWGGDTLLDSYEAERAPFHRRAIDEASLNYSRLSNDLLRPGLDEPGAAGDRAREETEGVIRRDKHREFNSLGLVLGHCYERSPIIVSDGTPAPDAEVETFTPRARPGLRTPHAWLAADVSLYDRLGPGLTLLSFDSGRSAEPWAHAAADRGIPLEVLRVGDPAIAELYGGRAVCVRPDQVIAWRSAGDAPPDAGAVLDVVCGRRIEPQNRTLTFLGSA